LPWRSWRLPDWRAGPQVAEQELQLQSVQVQVGGGAGAGLAEQVGQQEVQ